MTARATAHPIGRRPAPVAEWDFARSTRPLVDCRGSGLELREAPGPAVTWRADDLTGGGLRFAGDGGHLMIPAADAAPLDCGTTGEVTVLAMVRRAELGTGFIAGLWQEEDSDPRRQYGLFLDLPTYGGGEQVVGHVSADGRPSPGLPYSRDYAASARMVRPGTWRVIGFRYDGRRATAFLDGIADPRPRFTERPRPLGDGSSYAKNPYDYPCGLNPGPRSDFTVGAVLLSSGIGNAFHGDLARLAIWDRALDDAEIMQSTLAWTPPGEPFARFDWWRPDPAPGRQQGGWDGTRWPPPACGWQVDGSIGAHALGVEPGALARRRCPADSALLIATPGLRRDQLTAISAAVSEISGRAALFVRCGGARWETPLPRHRGSWRAELDAPVWRAAHASAAVPLDPDGTAITGIGLRFDPDCRARLGELLLWGVAGEAPRD